MTHLVLVLVLVAAVRTGACPVMCTCSRHLAVRCTQQVPAEIFTNLTNLQELVIENSDLGDLSNVSVADLELQSMRLSQNRIVSLPELNVTNLRHLDLSGNLIETLGVEFRTLRSLEILNLSANFLTVIDSDSFSGLESLKCLDLSRNNLTRLDDALFEPLQALQYLNLSSNQLTILNERCFISLVKLQQLDVSFNRLVRVELGSLQLPSLARLLLAGNSRLGASKQPMLVGTGQRLQTVDASNIGLEQVPPALTHSIRTLRLVGNSIKTVRCGDLDSYPLLQLLDFDSNGLEVIEDDALGRLDSLTILYLTNNNMSEIPKSLSEKLKVLHLEHNQIQQVRTRDLQGLTSLEVLLLNDNKIRLIEAEAFNQLTSLVTLDISRNPIKILEAGCLSGSMALQVLRLSNIDVDSPPKEVSFPLSSTEHLITLDLSGSPGLARQLLVDTAALAASRQLQELDLSFTDLEFIRSDLLHFLPQLRIFHIDGNRINCTQLEWLAAWMRRQDEPEYKRVTCVSPPELWGTLLIDLQPVEATPNRPTTTQTPTTQMEDYIDIESFLRENKSEIFPITNSTRGEMSMFSAGAQERLHPGLVLAAAMLGTALVLVLLGVRFAKRRRDALRLRQEDLEVSSLPGVTELW
ncbi:vasorin [Tribolium castaneum]|uniref:Protein slit-like Protein n=1 Tax=Tribolium castaneum TaxID=7070 RepID=A0A139WMC2_TRICA|nr:PREDICTED: vasorin [Tribolium castaneum]KYB29188.1 Protein slit-like Protein [Tribolium castaneum]|eukprot:XP_001812694.1 PREDICTED: vasorin [Tribolium castaneum]